MPLRVADPVAATVAAPIYNVAVSAAVWPAANRAVYARAYLPVGGVYRYANWVCGVSSGNIQVGVVQLSGANRTSYTRVMNSGVIACPAAADIRTDLGATYLAPGDYAIFLWADNTTLQARYATASSLPAMRMTGIESSLATGVLTSGTITWSNPVLNIALEGDV